MSCKISLQLLRLGPDILVNLHIYLYITSPPGASFLYIPHLQPHTRQYLGTANNNPRRPTGLRGIAVRDADGA